MWQGDDLRRLACSIHKAEKTLPETFVRTECALLELHHEHTMVLPRTASDETVDLCLVNDVDPVLADRLVCVLNRTLKALCKDDKGRLLSLCCTL